MEKRDTSNKGELKRLHFAEKDKLKKAQLRIALARLAFIEWAWTPKGIKAILKGFAFIVVVVIILIIAILNPELLAPLIQSLASFIE